MLLELPEAFSLDRQQGEKEWAGILMDVEVFNSVLCQLRIPPATSFKVGSCRQVLAPEAGIGTGPSKKVGKWGLSILPPQVGYLCISSGIEMTPSPASLSHCSMELKVKNPAKTCVIQQACGFLKFQKSSLDFLLCFYFLNYFISTPV